MIAIVIGSSSTSTKIEHAPFFERALAIHEETLGQEHPDVAGSLANLAILYYRQKRYPQADSLLGRAVSIQEKSLGPDHPTTVSNLANLAALYRVQDRHAEAGQIYHRLVAIQEKTLGPNHPQVAASLKSWAHSLRKIKQNDIAAGVEKASQGYLRVSACTKMMRGAADHRFSLATPRIAW